MTDRFDADFGVQFDMAIAQSVFTHVSLNHVRLCLHRVAKVMKPGGKFFATFTERPPTTPSTGCAAGPTPSATRSGTTARTFVRRPRTPFDFRYIGEWGHARNQRMVEYTRRPRLMVADGWCHLL